MRIDPDMIKLVQDGDAWTATYGTLSVTYRHRTNFGFHVGSMTAEQVKDLAAENFAVDLEEMTAHERLNLAKTLR